MLKIDSVIDGKYKILSKIGQGGMSIVYLAIDERTNKRWAIKEVRKDGKQNYEVVRQGLIIEADMLKKLKHPHLPSIVDVIEDEGCFLIVMDYIEGKTLSQVLREKGTLKQELVIEWTWQLCDVLKYLHTRSTPIIYRDMKPSNIMLKPDGNVMLIDFGTAREYKADSIQDTTCLGTRGYAAPEQFGGQGQTDVRTDIYCLGTTLYHLLTGHNPSDPPYEMYPIRQWNQELSLGLERIISKCTQRNPNDRYQSCEELMYALRYYDEVDLKYNKTQKRKCRLVIATSVLSFLSGITSIVFHNFRVEYGNLSLACIFSCLIFLFISVLLFLAFGIPNVIKKRTRCEIRDTVEEVTERLKEETTMLNNGMEEIIAYSQQQKTTGLEMYEIVRDIIIIHTEEII